MESDKRKREGYGMEERGRGGQGASSVKANCSPIEWNDSEELESEFGGLLCAGG